MKALSTIRKRLEGPSDAVFSGWVWGASLASLIGGSTACAAMQVAGIPFQRHYGLLLRRAMAACPKSTFSQIDVHYDTEFDPHRQSVFAQNHVSIMDGPLACHVIEQPFCGVFNHWHFHVPGYGWVMRLSKGIPVYPKRKNRTAEITRHARNRVREEKISILVFPEAHRTLDGSVREFKHGVFFMARDVGAPIVPLAVRGLFDVNHKGSSRFKPGHIEVFVGRQIETGGMSDDEIPALANTTRTIMADWIERRELPDGVSTQVTRWGF